MPLNVYVPLTINLQKCNTSHLLRLNSICHFSTFSIVNLYPAYTLTAFRTVRDPSNLGVVCKSKVFTRRISQLFIEQQLWYSASDILLMCPVHLICDSHSVDASEVCLRHSWCVWNLVETLIVRCSDPQVIRTYQPRTGK